MLRIWLTLVLKQTLWGLLASIGATLAIVYFFYHQPRPSVQLDDNALLTTTDAIISNLHFQKFNPEGQLIHRLITPHMTHIPLNNTYHLSHLTLFVMDMHNRPWSIQAEKAIALRGGEDICLQQHVLIHHAQDEQTQSMTVKTEEMYYHPKKQIAQTDKPITFLQAQNHIDSVGMKAYLLENRIQLLNQARGVYVPSNG